MDCGMNFPRAFFLSSLVLLISGGSQSISERLECTKSDVLGEQIISIELPSVSGGPSFKWGAFGDNGERLGTTTNRTPSHPV